MSFDFSAPESVQLLCVMVVVYAGFGCMMRLFNFANPGSFSWVLRQLFVIFSLVVFVQLIGYYLEQPWHQVIASLVACLLYGVIAWRFGRASA